jgi:hypothetical protein
MIWQKTPFVCEFGEPIIETIPLKISQFGIKVGFTNLLLCVLSAFAVRTLSSTSMMPVRMPWFSVIIGVLFVFAYLRPIMLIFRNPFAYHFSHGLLILGIIFYMLWSKRAALKSIEVR